MEYDSLNKDLENRFPELGPCLARLKEEWQPDSPGQYIVYEDVFGKFILRLVVSSPSHNRNSALARGFDFIDELLRAEGEVANLGFVAMLEGHPKWWFARVRNFLSKEAKSQLDTWRPEWTTWTSEEIGEIDLSYDPYDIQSVVDSVLQAASAKRPAGA